jgi:hypothetical protein
MDLTFYIKVVRYGLCWQVLTPDTWKLLCKKVRTLEKKAWAGWRRALYLWRKITEPNDRVWLLKNWPWAGAHFFNPLVHFFFSFLCALDVYTAVVTDPRLVETNSDPPKIFIPIPKIESTNGCARSDLLIRLLIF